MFGAPDRHEIQKRRRNVSPSDMLHDDGGDAATRFHDTYQMFALGRTILSTDPHVARQNVFRSIENIERT